MSSIIDNKEWRIEADDLATIQDAKETNWEQTFNILYPKGSEFFFGWVQRGIMYECLSARISRDNAFTRSDQATVALNIDKEKRVDQEETEIGKQRYYNKEATFRGWSDMYDYFDGKYKVWSTNYKLIYGTDWDKDLEIVNNQSSSKSKNSNVLSDEEKKKWIAKLKNAPISQFK
jgi:hypothetical protein